MFLIFDTETTGLPGSWNAPLTDFANWPRVVQIAWQLHSSDGSLISAQSLIVQPDGFTIPFNAEKVHGISTDRALREGLPLAEVIERFLTDVGQCTYIAGHNIEFDLNIMGCELLRKGLDNSLTAKKSLDTKDLSTDFCALPGGKNGKFKWPTLTELHLKLFNAPFAEAHDAAYDVDATAKCFFGLISAGVIRLKEIESIHSINYEAPQLAASNFKTTSTPEVVTDESPSKSAEVSSEIETLAAQFVHLHVHSQYSVTGMQSTSDIKALVNKAKSWATEGITPTLALTDHANMMAAFQFVSAALKSEVKPIVGCEVNLCRDMHEKKNQDNGFQIVLLAKTKKGYHNLAHLSSLAHTQGSYYVPRIDRNTLLHFKEDIIALTGGMYGEVAFKILNEGEEKAEEAFVWWKENFGENFYAEIMRHGLEEEEHVNRIILGFCEKHQVKFVATNSSYYTEQKDSEAQDALVCVREGEFVSRPKKYIGKRGREFRLGLPNNQYYLKSPQEMAALFSDLPEAITNTRLLADSCEQYKLSREVLLPKFDIPAEFQDALDETDGGKRGENNFLRHLTYVGAEKRYGTISDEIRERLDFELATIANTGYPGYFLIVQDFCNKAREMGVSVGPGRGSAAGSAVAYCIGITNVDPIQYQLLFERFLNPERVSMPDIDIDFDDEGRDKVIDYVRNKYGANMVAQIITYGTMGGKSAIRDAGRVIELPLPDTDRIAKFMPDNQDLSDLLKWDDKKLSDALSGDDLQNAKQLRSIAAQDSHEGRVVKLASILEGSVRSTGIHACGVIITPDVITNYVPVSTAKDSDMYCTQFDNSVVESAGLLKMDFLGLKTLTLIKDALRIIKQRHDIDIDIEAIPIDDELTYQLFQRGHTVGIFQYESDGMQKYMKDLKPTVFDDLIAMNALYRPGPLEYIPSFVRRKNGQEPITYDLPEMEEYLKDTYGITVYQEQVMLLSQKLAGFTKGEADVLRKAMGKKQKDVLDKMKGKFIEGAIANGHPADKLEKIWTDWEAFASYAFNKSHSTCYAWIAYQTAYLKAHYPAEYMAAVLSNNMSDIKQVSFFMQECKKQSIPVLGPDVNESKSLFSVNDKGEIRFGLAAVKGVGESAVESIISEQKKGRINSIFDFLGRVDARASNKKTIENLALSGALDAFGIERSSFFAPDGKNETYIETLVRYAAAVRDNKNTSQVSLFGDSEEANIAEPQPPKVEPWDTMTQLSKEKEVIGMFISGHPLDDFSLEVNTFCSKGGLSLLQTLESVNGRELKLAGTVVDVLEKTAKNGNPYGSFKLEDYETTSDFMMFGEDWLKYRHLIVRGGKLFVVGRVQPKRFGQDMNALEFRINRIELLGDIRKKMGRYLDIFVPMHRLNDELIERIATSLQNGTGKTQVRLRVLHEQSELLLPSNSFNKVNIETEALKALQDIPEIEFEVSES
jgi:DNA polymerase-3 subunit alpha